MAPRPARGFTLIELLGVLVIIAIALGLLAVSVGRSLESAKIRNAGREVMSALRYTRAEALVKRKAKFFEVDVEARVWTAPGRSPVELPAGMEVRLLTAETELTGDGSGRIRFFPDGSSSGGRITLVMGERHWRVGVAWLTGEIALLPLDDR